MCANRKNQSNAVHHRGDRGVHQSARAELADVQLDVGTLDADQRVQPVALAPGEPALELVGVQVVSVAGVPGQVGDRGELRSRHCGGLVRSRTVLSDMAFPHAASQPRRPARRQHDRALDQPH